MSSKQGNASRTNSEVFSLLVLKNQKTVSRNYCSEKRKDIYIQVDLKKSKAFKSQVEMIWSMNLLTI